MAPVETCRDCGRLFSFLPRGVCRECLDAREVKYREVRDWFRDNPYATVRTAAEAFDLPVSMISGWVAEGRLSLRVTPDEVVESEKREEERLERIRRALAETAASAPPPDDDEGPRRAARGMYGRD